MQKTANNWRVSRILFVSLTFLFFPRTNSLAGRLLRNSPGEEDLHMTAWNSTYCTLRDREGIAANPANCSAHPLRW
jgi:hypothetical protein